MGKTNNCQFNFQINREIAIKIRLWAIAEGISIGDLIERELGEKFAQIDLEGIMSKLPKPRHDNVADGRLKHPKP